VKFLALYFWIVLDDLISSTTSCFINPIYWFLLMENSGILGAVSYFGFLADCPFFLSSETFGKPDAWGYISVASVIFFWWDL